MSFSKAPSRLADFFDFQKNIGTPLTFGNSFLDAATGGIFPDDLVIVTARTGGGKTELVSQIAQINSEKKINVHFFALEAHKGEIESRIFFRLLSQAFFTQHFWRQEPQTPNYQDWLQGKQSDILDKFIPEVSEEFKNRFSTLHTYYRHGPFTFETFEAQLARIWDKTDLLVIDHLHYFDLDSDNENKAITETVKQIRDATSFYRKPVVLVVQLRKADYRNTFPVPALEEIHGSSNISKIATKILATAPARLDNIQGSPHVFPTFFRVLKNRTDGSRCKYTAVCGFDIQKNMYTNNFSLGEFDKDHDYNTIDRSLYPQWARRAL
jgi:hypothetical protein